MILVRADDDHTNLQLICASVDAGLQAIDVEVISNAFHLQDQLLRETCHHCRPNQGISLNIVNNPVNSPDRLL